MDGHVLTHAQNRYLGMCVSLWPQWRPWSSKHVYAQAPKMSHGSYNKTQPPTHSIPETQAKICLTHHTTTISNFLPSQDAPHILLASIPRTHTSPVRVTVQAVFKSSSLPTAQPAEEQYQQAAITRRLLWADGY